MKFSSEKFISAMKAKGYTNQDLVDKLIQDHNIDISLDGIKAYRRKNNVQPSIEKLIAISEILDVSVDYLLGVDNSKHIETQFIPLIGKSSCGKPQDYDLNGFDPIPIPKDLYRSGMYALEAEGDSMSPKINDRDIVFCCPDLAIDNGKIVHYWLDGESGIKKYKINEAGTIISLIPINSDYDIITIHCDENHDLRMAKVVGKIDKDF